MAYAPGEVYFKTGDASILGMFREHSTVFEFSKNNEGYLQEEYPHKVWVTEAIDRIDHGFRYARVLKTVAYIVVDEDDYGKPVTQKWNIKDLNLYAEVK